MELSPILILKEGAGAVKRSAGCRISGFSGEVFTSKNVTEMSKTILKKRKSDFLRQLERRSLPGVCQNRQVGKLA